MNSIRVVILLVQFMIRKLGELATNVSPDRRARMAKVVADGLSEPNTIDGIRAIQEIMRDSRPATIVDGRISSARGYDYSSGGTWTIVSINSALRRRSPSVWPRLLDFPDCPGELKIEVKKHL